MILNDVVSSFMTYHSKKNEKKNKHSITYMKKNNYTLAIKLSEFLFHIFLIYKQAKG